MNIKHSVNAPVVSGKRSMLRRFATVAAAASVLMLGIASASAGDEGKAGKGSYSLVGSATGGIAVKGEGKFKVRDVDGKLAFDSQIGGCKDLKMADGRQEHTCGEGKKSKINGMTSDAMVKLIIEKTKLSFPAAGKSVSGSAPGKVHFLGKASDVTVNYTVEEKGGKYMIKSAAFTFDYTKHTNEVCLGPICVKPEFKISVNDVEVDVKK